MQHRIIVVMDYDISIGKTNLNEIVYALKGVEDQLMLNILGSILDKTDDEIASRLTNTPEMADQELGRHYVKGHEAQECECGRARRRGYRGNLRHIKTVFGELKQKLRMVECVKCKTRYAPLLPALKIERYGRKEVNLEQEVIEAVIDTNYRRLTDGISVDLSLGGIHNIVVESDIDKTLAEPIVTTELQAILGDATGVKQYRGQKGELRAVIGITKAGRVKPLGSFVNTPWPEIEKEIRPRIQSDQPKKIPFIYDGEPEIDKFLADVTETQRCSWHAPRGLSYSLWNDGVSKGTRDELAEELKGLIGIELPEADYDLLKKEDKQAVSAQYEKSQKEMAELILTFKKRGYHKGASYLENLSKYIFTRVKIWIETGVISPKTTSLLERVFRELGRRLKKIAWGWSDQGALKMSKLILIKQYEPEKWEQYWLKKLGINGNFAVKLVSVEVL